MTMHFLTRTLLLTLLISGAAAASTWSDIAALDAAKSPAGTRAATASKPALPAARAPHWFRLSDGRRVNLNDWTVVLFMQSSCSYCHRFDPLLAQVSQETGLPVFVYSLDGAGDATFPNVLPATPEVMVEYFQNGTPVATPTTYLTHVTTNTAFPLLQGAVDKATLLARLNDVLTIALNGGLK